MPIDPHIILSGLKTPAITAPDPLEQYGKSLTLQNLMQQGDIGRRAIADDDATRSAYQESGGDPATLRALLAKSGQYKAVQAFDKVQGERELQQSTIKKNTAQTATADAEAINRATAQHRDQLAMVNDPQAAAQWVASAYQNPTLAPLWGQLGKPEEVVAKIPQDPAAFAEWKQKMALGATEFIKQNKPNVHMQDVGGASNIVTMPGLGGPPTVVSSTPKTQTPDSVATDARVASEGRLNRGNSMSIAGMADARARDIAGMTDARARDANNVAQGNRQQSGVIELRKEFNALPEVKQFKTVVPIINSISRAPDTPAGDLDLIYGVGKILDPDSVVREGEMTLVIKSGSPMERFKGQVNYITSGRGRLTPDARAQLTEMLNSRVKGLEENYKAARTTFETAADRGGLPRDQIFIDTPAIPAPAPKPAATPAPAQPTRVNSLSQADPAKYSGQVATGDDGIKYKSDGRRWVRVP